MKNDDDDEDYWYVEPRWEDDWDRRDRPHNGPHKKWDRDFEDDEKIQEWKDMFGEPGEDERRPHKGGKGGKGGRGGRGGRGGPPHGKPEWERDWDDDWSNDWEDDWDRSPFQDAKEDFLGAMQPFFEAFEPYFDVGREWIIEAL